MNTNFDNINKDNSFAKIPFKIFISGVSILAFIILFIVLWSNPPTPSQIKDTNGPDNYALAIISEDDIILNTCGNTGLNKGTNNTEQTVTYNSEQFSGTEQLSTAEFGGCGDTISIDTFDVKSGNARLVVIEDGKIVYEFIPNSGTQSFTSNGHSMNVVFAGESADFNLIYSTK